MKLDLFCDYLDEEINIHPKYRLLKNETQLNGEREVIKDWTEEFEDRDNKIIHEFQTTFHSAFWEFFLFKLFKSCGYVIDFSKNRPDFIVKSPIEMNIEAVVSEIKKDGTKEDQRTLEDVLSMIVPPNRDPMFNELLDEAITRYSNAICGKASKFEKSYSKCDWVKQEIPYVIALSSYSQINYGREYHFPMLALLYGMYYNAKSNAYRQKGEIMKPGTNSPISLGLFTDERLSNVSAIIFSCTMSLGKLTALAKSKGIANPDLNYVFQIRHDTDDIAFKPKEINSDTPEELSDGVFVFYNPFAKNKLESDILSDSNAIHVRINNGVLEFNGDDLPLVSRVNIPKIFLPKNIKNKLIEEMVISYNPECRFSNYKIIEIDIENLEIELLDINNGMTVFVDLNESNLNDISEQSLCVGDVVAALLKSHTDGYGNTSKWSLISIA